MIIHGETCDLDYLETFIAVFKQRQALKSKQWLKECILIVGPGSGL